MCGIIGIASSKPVSMNIINSLKRLEYRGYDSAGISLLNGKVKIFKKKGKVSDLEDFVKNEDVSGNITTVQRVVTVIEKEEPITFVLNKAKTTIPVGEEYTDTGCSGVMGTTVLTCEVKENNVDTTTQGIYTIVYEVKVGGTSYTHTRYVYVYDESFNVELYYYKDKEELMI